MSIRMIEQRMTTYSISSEIEEMQALREITQEVVLASLGRAGFFFKKQYSKEVPVFVSFMDSIGLVRIWIFFLSWTQTQILHGNHISKK